VIKPTTSLTLGTSALRVRVSAPSRIHISLVDLTGDLGRLDGGAGIALKLPRTVVVAEESSALEYTGPREDEVVPKIRALGLAGKVSVLSSPLPHVGLGSTTALLLSVAKALATLNGIRLSSRELALLVGRGGTSGVGVAVFEKGGAIVDFGHDVAVKKRPLPSGASLAAPPSYIRIAVPEGWTFVVAFPEREGTFNEKREVDEFLKRTPLPPEESAKAARIMFMLLIPSLLEDDISLFNRAVNMLQGVGFKKIEVELQDDITKEVMEVFRRTLGSAGLSSMGPAVYSAVPFKRARRAVKEVSEALPEGWRAVLTFPDNRGADVRVLKA